MESKIQTVRRPRRSAADIQNLLAEFQISNQTVTTFCASKSIQTSSFHKWVSRAKVKQSNRSGFAPVQVSASTASGLFAEVNGIRIFQQVSAEFLKLLL